jgi:hypothetical protein
MRAPFKCDPGSVIVLRRLAMRGGFHRWRGLISILGNLTPSVSVGIGSPMEEGCFLLSGCGDTCGGQVRGGTTFLFFPVLILGEHKDDRAPLLV